MGIGCIAQKQAVKGIMALILEAAYILFMVNTGLGRLAALPGLGSAEQEKVWNEAKQVYEYTAGDNSLLILLYGIVTLFVTAAFVLLWAVQLRQSYFLQVSLEEGRHIRTFSEDIGELFNSNLHITLMSLPMLGIIVFNIIPLVYMISMAFTSYSKEGNHLILFDWIGFQNFGRVLNLGGNLGRQFWSVLAWTIVWAVVATVLNYILGMMLAMVINRKETKAKAFWRFCFVLSVAVPQFVSLLIMRTMLQQQGAINVILQNMGLIDSPLPFFQNAMWARVTVIVVNLWVGIPYTILQITGILQNIPGELYEAAKMDGAGPVTIFWKITLPYMLFVTMPYLITQFTGNINNFNVIYLLTKGDPTSVGDTAGKTDLLVTWLYKLTVDQQYFNIGAVIGILTFVVLAIVALVTYRNSASYKNEEAFM
ncbi:MAG: sugar ABC transporter permease [Lachnospiraceae bacterium]|nr:sugar ABC transporter permease [Lachnospiraceae bacterium]